MLVEDRRQRRTQVERSTATQKALIRAARSVFANGYYATPAEDVVAKARVSSGALYHHFGDKRGLFRAAFDAVETELAERVRGAALGGRDPWKQLELGIGEYLRACIENEVRQIVLVDGPSVLGWEEWREADAAHHLRPLAAALASAMRAGFLERRPALTLARVLLGALTEAGLAQENDEMFWVLRKLRA
jgi:AcrR family transcriptional regulator